MQQSVDVAREIEAAATRFAEQGWAVVQDLLPGGLVADLAEALDALCARAPQLPAAVRARSFVFEKDLPAKARDGVPAAEVGDAVFIASDLAAHSPVWRVLLDQPALGALARAVLGSDAACLHFMNGTIKQPHWGRAIAWHRDFPNHYLCPSRSSFVRLMLCLDGMQAEGGATRFIPGSHRIGDDTARQAKGEGGIGPSEARPAPGDGVAATCAPGAIVLIHPKVLHGGPVNRGGRIRRNVVLQAGVPDDPPMGLPESVTGWLLA